MYQQWFNGSSIIRVRRQPYGLLNDWCVPNSTMLQCDIQATMPFWKPGSLAEDDSWAVTAFLLRQNGLRDDRAELNASNADQARVRAPEAESTPAPRPVKNPPGGWTVSLLILAGGAALSFLLWRTRRPPNSSA